MMRSRPRLLLAGALLLCAGWLNNTAPGLAQILGTPGHAGIRRCGTDDVDAARSGCANDAGAAPRNISDPVPGPAGTWRLLRTPSSADGHETVSVVQTADVSRSDVEFAGLMLHCGQTQPQVMVVLVRPLPPRTHPQVTVTAGGASTAFTASVVPPGALVLLPPEATALATGPWQAASELAVVVKDDSTVIRGAVSLSGLGTALETLRSNCPPR